MNTTGSVKLIIFVIFNLRHFCFYGNTIGLVCTKFVKLTVRHLGPKSFLRPLFVTETVPRDKVKTENFS